MGCFPSKPTHPDPVPPQPTRRSVRPNREYKILDVEEVCRPSEVGVDNPKKARNLASEKAITFTTLSSVIIFNTIDHSTHIFLYDFEPPVLGCVSHSLSPDQKILVRWRRDIKDDDAPWTIRAIDVETDKIIASLPGHHLCTVADTQRATWSSQNVVYIVDSNQGLITRWSISANGRSTTSVIRPTSTVTLQPMLIFDLSKDGRWWVANGTSGEGESGTIQIHDTQRNESRETQGTACCVAEVDMQGQKKALFLTCNIVNERLMIKIEQLDMKAPGTPFKQININVDTLTPSDTPKKIRVLEGLQIVVVNTSKNTVYLFDLQTGTQLHSQSLAPGIVWRVGDDERSLLVNQRDTGTIERVSVNTRNLIEYLRQGLGNEALANAMTQRIGR